MKNKGQAAMEFLMTYGWAILVVLAAIGALAYFGVLSPSSLLPEKTTFQAPLPNIDNAVVRTDGTVTIAFRNNKGSSIRIYDSAETTPSVVSGTDDCSGANAIDSVMAADGTTSTSGAEILNGDVFVVTFSGCTAKAATSRFDATIQFEYTNEDTGVTRPHSGEVKGKVVA